MTFFSITSPVAGAGSYEVQIGRIEGTKYAITKPAQETITGDTITVNVLGRDVTNNFGVIYDYPNRAVALLAPPHFYEIKRTF